MGHEAQCRNGMVEMFSDASNRQVGGASFIEDRLEVNTVFKAVLAKEEKVKSSMYQGLSQDSRGVQEVERHVLDKPRQSANQVLKQS